MFDTIVPALPRRGTRTVNTELDQLVGEIGWLTTSQFADLIAADQVLGHIETDDTPNSGPVGRWVLSQLQSVGVDAAFYTWVSELAVYDSRRRLVGEVRVPSGHTMSELAHEVNDLLRPELTWMGENDPR